MSAISAVKAWWQDPAVKAWAWELWRYYSWRPRYTLTLTTTFPTAFVDMQGLRVVCNPEYAYPPASHVRQVRFLPAGVQAFQRAYLESLIAHEAGHTHHTGALPPGLLGQLVNIIEDHRMEALMARDFAHLGELFTLAADADAAHALANGGSGGDLIRGCLLHRFTAAHPTWAYTPDGPDAPLWPQVREILEAAWAAPTYGAVVEAARRILNLLGLDPNAPRRDDLQMFLDAGLEGLPQVPEAEGAGSGEGGGDGPGAGGSKGARPKPPQLDGALSPEASRLSTVVEGHARALAAKLNPPVTPGRVQASRDRGRYRYDREATGSERPFDLRTTPTRPGPAHVRVAVDVSLSMNAARMEAARLLTFTLRRATLIAGVPMIAVAFDDQVHDLVLPGGPVNRGLNAVAGLRAMGGTELAPALRRLWKPELSGHSVTFVVTDGQLGGGDYAACARLMEGHPGTVVPVLLGGSEEIARQYQETFGRCVLMQNPGELVGHVLAFLHAKRW